MTESRPLDSIVWDPSIYPRSKPVTATIERYVDALEAGDEFPPVIVEATTMRLLDGKHRLEAYKRFAKVDEDPKAWRDFTIPVEKRTVPEGMTAKHYAATLSARHGERMSYADLKQLATEQAEASPKDFDAGEFSRDMGVAKSTVYDWVGHILGRDKEERRSKVLRLAMLGWSDAEIGAVLDVSYKTAERDRQESESGLLSIRELDKSKTPRHEIARRFNMPPTLVEAITLDGADDAKRLAKLGIKTQPYDVWQFSSCHDLMGDAHPGRIPGELVAHVLYFLTDPGDLVVDPMAGSGTTLDACLLMGRKARGYDIDARHERIDVESHDLSTGWPDTVGKARLIFWDPPYFDKMDRATIGESDDPGTSGYREGSISGLGPDDYLDWFAKRFDELHAAVQPGTRLAFLMSDWDPENAKQHHDHRGIFIWDYADRLRDAGWTLKRQIQCPLPTEQVHPDIVIKHREARRLGRLERYLLMAEA